MAWARASRWQSFIVWLWIMSPQESGTAAGLYSMGRFLGSIVGLTLVGVFLQQALLIRQEAAAYQLSFWLLAAFAVLGVVVIWGVKD